MHPEQFNLQFELQLGFCDLENVVLIAFLGHTSIHFPHLIHSALLGVLYAATFISHFFSHKPHFVHLS